MSCGWSQSRLTAMPSLESRSRGEGVGRHSPPRPSSPAAGLLLLPSWLPQSHHLFFSSSPVQLRFHLGLDHWSGTRGGRDESSVWTTSRWATRVSRYACVASHHAL